MTAIDYCTRAEVETYAGITFSDGIGPTDTQIDAMITNASRLVDMYAGVQLAGTKSHTEYHDSTYRMRLIVLKNRPVVAVTTLKETKSDGTTVTLLEGRERANKDWWLDDNESGIIRLHSQAGINALQLFKVEYTSGYVTAPIEAKMATIMLVIRQAARAALNDENCQERIKDMWRPLLASTETEYREMLEKVKSKALVGVTVFGNGGA
tara:strand:- start:14940 stop:15566 length:627 start_codon:yes stop_codon:yes gene_type:complete